VGGASGVAVGIAGVALRTGLHILAPPPARITRRTGITPSHQNEAFCSLANISQCYSVG
jgi:hypothetical protein